MLVSTQFKPHQRLRSLSHASIQITQGFWAQRQAMNRQITIRHGYERLQAAGNFFNLQLAAGRARGEYQGPLFMDSDLYKWIEAAGWDYGNQPDAQLLAWLDECAELLAAAQQPDGYLNSYYTVVAPQKRWQELDHGHELYCAGHLFQAAVAVHRSTGRTHLLEISRRFADHIYDVFGPGKRDGYCGHPEIEMALVELYRETGEARYLELAGLMIDRRGQKRLKGLGWAGPEYLQDHLPLRQTSQVVGHAVRQLYLTAGAADLYLETGETELMAALERLWQDAVGRKMHLTGGYGARFEGEAFGEAYELPSDRCYCETCAAIAAMMWNWRMLLATGEARFAEALERSLYNNFISGISLDGEQYFYTNVLSSPGGVARKPWFGCACCPPNIMRQTATLAHYVATESDAGAQIHQYISTHIQTRVARLALKTEYPWEEVVQLDVLETRPETWTLSLRIPSWAAGATARVNGERWDEVARPGQYLTLARAWKVGDQVELWLPQRPRLTAAHPRVDALRGQAAIERGPLVYCLEQADQPAGLNLMDARIDPAMPLKTVWRPDLLGGVMTVEFTGAVANPRDWEDNLYQPAAETPVEPTLPVNLTAIPYYAWANRGAEAMRVWLARVGE